MIAARRWRSGSHIVLRAPSCPGELARCPPEGALQTRCLPSTSAIRTACEHRRVPFDPRVDTRSDAPGSHQAGRDSRKGLRPFRQFGPTTDGHGLESHSFLRRSRELALARPAARKTPSVSGRGFTSQRATRSRVSPTHRRRGPGWRDPVHGERFSDSIRSDTPRRTITCPGPDLPRAKAANAPKHAATTSDRAVRALPRERSSSLPPIDPLARAAPPRPA